MKHTLNMAPTECPECFAKIDAATHYGNRKLKPGSVTICAYCGTVLQYEEDMSVRKLTEQEFAELPHVAQGAFRAAQAEIQAAGQRLTKKQRH